MATFPEARAAKAERSRREARYYTPDKRGPACPVCRNPTDPVVVEATQDPRHPTCAEPTVMRATQVFA